MGVLFPCPTLCPRLAKEFAVTNPFLPFFYWRGFAWQPNPHTVRTPFTESVVLPERDKHTSADVITDAEDDTRVIHDGTTQIRRKSEASPVQIGRA